MSRVLSRSNLSVDINKQKELIKETKEKGDAYVKYFNG